MRSALRSQWMSFRQFDVGNWSPSYVAVRQCTCFHLCISGWLDHAIPKTLTMSFDEVDCVVRYQALPSTTRHYQALPLSVATSWLCRTSIRWWRITKYIWVLTLHKNRRQCCAIWRSSVRSCRSFRCFCDSKSDPLCHLSLSHDAYIALASYGAANFVTNWQIFF